jgi:hypothetical protein
VVCRVPDLKPARDQVFEHFYFAIQAAIEGLGVAMGPLALVSDELREGRLVAPIKEPAIRTRGYFVYAPEPHRFAAMAARRRPLGRSRISRLPLLRSDLSSQAMQIFTKGFELIIFDCDGVLVDSEPIINRAHAQVLTACGYSITEEALVERFCGMSDPEMLNITEHEWGRALPANQSVHAHRYGRRRHDRDA